MHNVTRNLIIIVISASGVLSCSGSSTPTGSDQPITPSTETDDSELLNQFIFPDQRMADYYRCEYDRMSSQSSALGMTAYAMADRVNLNDVTKIWCRASGEDAGLCQMPAFSLLKNPGTAGNYLKAGYGGSSFPVLTGAQVEQIRVPSVGEQNWVFTYYRSVLGDSAAEGDAGESFQLSYQNTQTEDLISIPNSTQRYTIEGAIIELPTGSGDALIVLASSPEEFQARVIGQIDALAVLVSEHIIQNYSGELARQLQSAADTKLSRQRELVQLHSTDFHALLVDVANPDFAVADASSLACVLGLTLASADSNPSALSCLFCALDQ